MSTPSRVVQRAPTSRSATHRRANASSTLARAIRGAKRGDNERRDAWADALPRDGGALRDPPAVLRDVCVVFCEPKIASNVGAFARACAAFECCDLRVVTPMCDVESRAATSAAKGARRLVPRASEVKSSLEEALVGCSLAVAFHPWEDEAAPERRFRSVEALAEAAPGGEDGKKLALVFGNEADGLTAAQLGACDCVCTLPMGRLVESLSVTHAGVIALSTYFSRRDARGRVARGGSG